MKAIEERVERLEVILSRFLINTDIALSRMEKGIEEFKSEMREDAKKRDAEMKEFKDEMSEFKDEMSEFKDGMKKSQDRQDKEIKKSNQQAGELSRKFGTLVEDMVLPSLPKIIEDKFDLEIETQFLYPRVKRKHGATQLSKEFDAFIIAGNLLFLNSTKSKLRSPDIKEFIKDISLFREYFPEYKNKKVIGVLASLYPEESVIKQAEKCGFLVLGLSDWLMELKNSKNFKPKEY